jgi:DNA replication protein DnaC
MLLQPTIEKLRALRLTGMLRAFEQQLQDPETKSLSFEDRLGLMLDTESAERNTRRLASRLKAAKPKQQACLEDVKVRVGLDRSALRQLAQCDWAKEHRNILITGATGSGKTYLACSLINSACRAGYTALYYRAKRLLTNITIAKADGSYTELLSKLARVNVLVIDDFGHSAIPDDTSSDFLEIIDDRDSKSTIIASQLPFDLWHQTFANATVADAIMDRIIHSSYKFTLEVSKSLRDPSTDKTKENNLEF